MARHWQWPVVLMAGLLLADGPLAAGRFAERVRVVAARAVATLAFADMGTSWGSDGLGDRSPPAYPTCSPLRQRCALAIVSKHPSTRGRTIAGEGALVQRPRYGQGSRLGALRTSSATWTLS